MKPALCFLLSFTLMACATTSTNDPFGHSTQLLVVTTSDWDATNGKLTIHERSHGAWTQVGDPIEVVVGRTGLAWGSGLALPLKQEGPIKKEGDG